VTTFFLLLIWLGGFMKLNGYGRWRRVFWPYYLGMWMARLPRDEVGFARDTKANEPPKPPKPGPADPLPRTRRVF
jgi:hypothetical protein